jgi:1-acyl-sn-glycerol-3-phosphate acyltransferase
VILGHPPPPSRTAGRLFQRYVRGQVRQHFAGVHWTGAERAAGWDPALPVLALANHTNWWDGFLAVLVTGRLGRRFQILMEAKNLARYRVFLRVGAVPLHRDRPRQAYHDLLAAVDYLRPGSALWISPQGERRPPAEPLDRLERGAALLALRAGRPIRICPVAFRYTFVSEQRPEAFVQLGDDWVLEPGAETDRDRLMRRMAGALGATVAALDRRLAAEQLDGFRSLAPGRLSVNKQLDRARHAVGLLRGPFEARNG